MRSIWTGNISLGLINIPVHLKSAVTEKGLDFTLVHKDDNCRINYARVCRQTGKEIPLSEIARAYEIKKNNFVVLEDSDFKAANVEKYNSIVIMGFIGENDISKVYYEKPYYIVPDEGFQRAYYLLAKTLEQTKKLGISKFILRNRESLAAIGQEDNRLILFQLRFADDIKQPDYTPSKLNLERKEISLARVLVENLSEPFNIEDFHDTYSDELMKIIERKSRGEKIKPQPKVKRPQVSDLVTQLERSLGQMRK